MSDLLIRDEDDWFITDHDDPESEPDDDNDHPSLTAAERNPLMLLP
jgi:hypothetical protein